MLHPLLMQLESSIWTSYSLKVKKTNGKIVVTFLSIRKHVFKVIVPYIITGKMTRHDDFHYSYGLGTTSRINWKQLNKIYFPVFSPSIVHLLCRLILTYMCVCMPVINWQGMQQFILTVTGHSITRNTKPDLHRYTEEGHRLQDHGWNQVCHAAWTGVCGNFWLKIVRDSGMADSNGDDDPHWIMQASRTPLIYHSSFFLFHLPGYRFLLLYF